MLLVAKQSWTPIPMLQMQEATLPQKQQTVCGNATDIECNLPGEGLQDVPQRKLPAARFAQRVVVIDLQSGWQQTLDLCGCADTAPCYDQLMAVELKQGPSRLSPQTPPPQRPSAAAAV